MSEASKRAAKALALFVLLGMVSREPPQPALPAGAALQVEGAAVVVAGQKCRLYTARRGARTLAWVDCGVVRAV